MMDLEKENGIGAFGLLFEENEMRRRLLDIPKTEPEPTGLLEHSSCCKNGTESQGKARIRTESTRAQRKLNQMR
jgi:hypothetical protein